MRPPTWRTIALPVLRASLAADAQKVPVGPVFQANQTVGGQPGDFRFAEGTTDARDQLVWQFDRGAETGPEDLGDPFTTPGS